MACSDQSVPPPPPHLDSLCLISSTYVMLSHLCACELSPGLISRVTFPTFHLTCTALVALLINILSAVCLVFSARFMSLLCSRPLQEEGLILSSSSFFKCLPFPKKEEANNSLCIESAKEMGVL